MRRSPVLKCQPKFMRRAATRPGDATFTGIEMPPKFRRRAATRSGNATFTGIEMPA